LVIALYVLLSGLWVFGFLDQQLFFGNDAAAWTTLATFALVHVLVGFAVGRWWSLFLPLITLAMAAPLGYPSANRGEPFPVWFSVMLIGPVVVLLIAAGLGLRVLVARSLSSPVARGTSAANHSTR
jgi:hypothetical protein